MDQPGLDADRLTVVDHPLVAHKVSTLRPNVTDSASFRALCREVTLLSAYEALLHLPTTEAEIETPLSTAKVPMLATGGSAMHAIDILHRAGATSIDLLCIVGCPEGVAAVHQRHSETRVTSAALDERLNDDAYIVPGLGDAGDRIFGT